MPHKSWGIFVYKKYCKVIQGKDRYYLQWREADKVKTRYIKLSELPELSAQIERRIALQQRLAELQVASVQYNVGGASVKMAAENGEELFTSFDQSFFYFSNLL